MGAPISKIRGGQRNFGAPSLKIQNVQQIKNGGGGAGAPNRGALWPKFDRIPTFVGSFRVTFD